MPLDEIIVRKAKLADRPSIEMLCKEQNGRLCNELVIKYRTLSDWNHWFSNRIENDASSLQDVYVYVNKHVVKAFQSNPKGQAKKTPRRLS